MLGPEWFLMIVNSMEEFDLTLNFTSTVCQTAWIGGSTNKAQSQGVIFYSRNPEEYIPNDSGIYKTRFKRTMFILMKRYLITRQQFLSGTL